MKKNILYLLFSAVLLAVFSPTFTASANVNDQITDLKKANRAIVSVTTYSAAGAKLHEGTGVFISSTGECLAPYTLFAGASKADITDYKGKTLPVGRILGASSTYDLVKFTIEGAKKVDYLSIATIPASASESPLHLMRHTTGKKAVMPIVRVLDTEEYEKYNYYQISAANTAENFGLPVVNEAGLLMGFSQKNQTKNDSLAYAVDARFANELSIGTIGIISEDLRRIAIPKALPATEKDALTYIYMLGTRDSATSYTALNDFIATYPENAEGYTNRARCHAIYGKFGESERDFLTAMEKAGNGQSTIKADEVHNEFSKQIYQQAISGDTTAAPGWTLRRACEEAEKAFAITPNPFYLLQQGRCHFAMKDYRTAYERFHQLATFKDVADSLSWSTVARAEAWFYAARSLELAGGDTLQIIALVDSTIACYPSPYPPAAAPYLLYRAQLLENSGEYRRAIHDYNEYEKAIGPKNLNAQFYYIREQAELKARMFQQALDDIRTAIAYAPDEPAFKIEEALIMLRAGLFKETIEACRKLIASSPDWADAYKLMGIAYGELGQKAQALASLSKAKELGDENADIYLKKYQ